MYEYEIKPVRKIIKYEKDEINSTIGNYINICSENKLLTAKEEIECAEIINNQKSSLVDIQKSKDKLVKSNIKLVIKLAKKYKNNTTLQLEDLISNGIMGLTIASSQYNPEKFKTRFSTYCYGYIKKYILMACAKEQLTHVPSNLNDIVYSYRKIKNEIPGIYESEILKLLKISQKKFKKILEIIKNNNGIVYFDKELENGGNFADIISDKNSKNQIEIMMEKEENNIIKNTIDKLDKIDFDIINDYFYNNQQYHIIGEKYNITGEAVRQKIKKALKKMKWELVKSDIKNSI